MKVLKIIGIVLGSLFLIIALVGFLQPQDFHVEKSIVTKAPLEVVFDHVNDMNKRHKWSPWENMDSTIVIENGDISKGKGASYSWMSQTQGGGSMIYTEVIENEKIISELDFKENGKGIGTFDFKEVEDGTLVNWSMDTDLGMNPFKRLLFSVLKPGMVEVFDQGLTQLSVQAEAAAAANPVLQIEVVTRPMEIIASIIDSSSWDQMENKMGANFEALMNFVSDRDLEIVNGAMTIYHKWDEKNQFATYETAVSISSEIEANDDLVMVRVVPEHKAAKGVHLGSYDESGTVYAAIETFLNENNMEMKGMPYEVYIKDPSMVSDESELVTHIFYPI